AAQQLKVTWESASTLPGNAGLYDQMRQAKTEDRPVQERGDVAGAVNSAAHVVSLSCHAPYQSHAPFGPNCALADVKTDSALVMCSTQYVYGVRRTLGALLKIPAEKVRVQYYE